MMDGGAFVDQAFLSYQSAQQPKAAMGAGKVSADKARVVAQDFEAFFVSRMIESMFAGIRTDGPFGGGNGEKVFRSVMVQEYGKEIAKRGGFGIADMVQQELMKMQEVAGNQ